MWRRAGKKISKESAEQLMQVLILLGQGQRTLTWLQVINSREDILRRMREDFVYLKYVEVCHLLAVICAKDGRHDLVTECLRLTKCSVMVPTDQCSLETHLSIRILHEHCGLSSVPDEGCHGFGGIAHQRLCALTSFSLLCTMPILLFMPCHPLRQDGFSSKYPKCGKQRGKMKIKCPSLSPSPKEWRQDWSPTLILSRRLVSRCCSHGN